MMGNETIFYDSAANLVSTLGLPAYALARIAGAFAGGQALSSMGLLVLLLLFPSSTYQPGAPGYQALKDVNWSVPSPLSIRPSPLRPLRPSFPRFPSLHLPLLPKLATEVTPRPPPTPSG